MPTTTNHKVADLFAQCVKTDNGPISARNHKNTFYYVGSTIYSYGQHFPIAWLTRDDVGPCVEVTTRKYSCTTSRHTSLVRSALPRAGVRVKGFLVQDN